MARFPARLAYVIRSTRALDRFRAIRTGKNETMEAWVPVLSVREIRDGCRLTLSGIAHGDGATLQQAANELVTRVVEVSVALRGGLTFSSSLPPPHAGLLTFLHEIGTRAARGEDVRDLVLGAPSRTAP